MSPPSESENFELGRDQAESVSKDPLAASRATPASNGSDEVETSAQLSQDDIDRLLAQALAPERSSAVLSSEARREGKIEAHIEPFDFRTPIFLSEFEMRRIRILHGEFVRFLEARLAMSLRSNIIVRLLKLVTIPYGHHTSALPDPAHICLFKINPLPGIGLIDMAPRLALTFASKILGAVNPAVNQERNLTEIETDLIDELLGAVLAEWSVQWDYEHALEPVIVGHEISGRFLQTSGSDAIVVLIVLEVEMNDVTDQIRLALPLHTMEPLIRKLQEKRKREMETTVEHRGMEWRACFGELEVNVDAVWHTQERTVSEWLGLRVNDVVPLQCDSADTKAIQLSLSGLAMFDGEAGVTDGQWSVRIRSKLNPSE